MREWAKNAWTSRQMRDTWQVCYYFKTKFVIRYETKTIPKHARDSWLKSSKL